MSTPQCNALTPGNLDIGGPGVIAIFLILAWLTMATCTIPAWCSFWYCWNNPRGATWKTWFRSKLEPRHEGDPSADDVEDTTAMLFSKALVRALVDLQVVTGFSIIIVALAQLPSLSFYYEQIATLGWWLTLNSFWASRIDQFYREEETKRVSLTLRKTGILGSVALGIGFQIYVIVREDRDWDPNVPGRCYNEDDDSSDWPWIVGVLMYIIALILQIMPWGRPIAKRWDEMLDGTQARLNAWCLACFTYNNNNNTPPVEAAPVQQKGTTAEKPAENVTSTTPHTTMLSTTVDAAISTHPTTTPSPSPSPLASSVLSSTSSMTMAEALGMSSTRPDKPSREMPSYNSSNRNSTLVDSGTVPSSPDPAGTPKAAVIDEKYALTRHGAKEDAELPSDKLETILSAQEAPHINNAASQIHPSRSKRLRNNLITLTSPPPPPPPSALPPGPTHIRYRPLQQLLSLCVVPLFWTFREFVAVWSSGDSFYPAELAAYVAFAAWNSYDLLSMLILNKGLVVLDYTGIESGPDAFAGVVGANASSGPQGSNAVARHVGKAKWGFGQVLPLVMVGLLIYAGVDGFKAAKETARQRRRDAELIAAINQNTTEGGDAA